MIYRIGIAALTIAAFAAAQNSGGPFPPAYRGVQTRVSGVFVTPVAGVPFSAVVVIDSTQTLPNGSANAVHSSAHIARDSQGRIYNEASAMLPAAFSGTPPVVSAHIYDPQTRLNTFLAPATRIARQSTLRTPPSPTPGPLWDSIPVNNPYLKKEDLGADYMENVAVHGFRLTRTAPALGNIQIVDEYWYADDLHMYMLTRHSDPRTGLQTVRLTQLNRAEPDPALFRVPPGYKIVDENPPQ